jgi:hypothetical protein
VAGGFLAKGFGPDGNDDRKIDGRKIEIRERARKGNGVMERWSDEADLEWWSDGVMGGAGFLV